jgi:hypothetical protein
MPAASCAGSRTRPRISGNPEGLREAAYYDSPGYLRRAVVPLSGFLLPVWRWRRATCGAPKQPPAPSPTQIIRHSCWKRRRACALAGDLPRAEATARAITDLRRQAWALARLPQAAAQAGDLGRAEGLARAIAEPFWRAQALTDLIPEAARAGDPARAAVLTDEGEAAARMIMPEDQERRLRMVSQSQNLDT